MFYFRQFPPSSLSSTLSLHSLSLTLTLPHSSSLVWAVDGSGRSLHKLVRTLTGHAHRINSLALNCDYVLRTGAFQIGEGIAIAGGGSGSQAAAEDVLVGDLSFIQDKALQRYKAVVGSEGER